MKSLSSLLAALLACVLPLAACDNKGETQRPQMPPPEVTVIEVHAEAVPLTRELVGRLAAVRRAEVRARVAGIVLERAYKEGSDVKKGQVLFRIDPAPLQAALAAERAALVKARADADNAAAIATRYQDLFSKALISSQDRDDALAEQRTTAAAVEEAEARVEQARLDLDYATVTAPIAGRVGRARVTEGALVGQGEATVLTTVEQVDPVYVNFSQPVTELQQLPGGMPLPTDGDAARVEVILSDQSLYPHEGRLDFSNPAVDAGTDTISLRAVVPNPEFRLLPGMFVKLRVTVGRLEGAYLVPQEAVARDEQGPYVFVVAAGGKVEQRHVEGHGMTRQNWILTGALHDGDRVVVEGLQKVRPGAAARAVLKEGAQAAQGAVPAGH